jgi:mono/diheme cytochrome c family protein
MRYLKKIFIAALVVIVGIAVIGGIAYALFKDDVDKLWADLHPQIPEYSQPKKTVWLDQNVSKEKLSWFYHADQGTRTFGIPLKWFTALEQPELSLIPFVLPGKFSDPRYLDRYGFIPDTIIPNKNALPIGMAEGGPMLDPSGEPWRNPRDRSNMNGIGLTCAACHTGRFTYKDTAVVIDGGPALTSLFVMKQGIGVALLMTRVVPGRFGRFADQILGSDSTLDDRETLKNQLSQVLNQYKQVKNLEEAVGSQSILEGFGRLDALNRIGNQVFSLDLKKPENYAGSSAPVHYPRIWNTPWFDWVQYNGSIMRPMVRNAGESLGVSAELNLTEPSKGLFKSSVDVKKLFEMEQMVKGEPAKEGEPAPQPNAKDGFPGLKSPKWPADLLGTPVPELVKAGGDLYVKHCAGCHGPSPASEAFFDFSNKKRWRTNENGEHILLLENISIEHIGTDPAQAEDMRNRTVALPANLGIDKTSFALALGAVVEKTVDYIYDRQTDKEGKPLPPLTAAERQRLNGYMPDELRADLAYKVRPLNGIWATPPYLHNGSVPTIYKLLSPLSERPTTFWLGNREYDPENLGYETHAIKNGFEFNTKIRGNSNSGHRFEEGYSEDKSVKGIIGPLLKPEERKALIEYLKTL